MIVPNDALTRNPTFAREIDRNRELIDASDLPDEEKRILFELTEFDCFAFRSLDEAIATLTSLKAKRLLTNRFNVKWSVLVANHLGASQ